MPRPEIKIDYDDKGAIRLTSNVKETVVLVGILRQAEWLVMMQPKKEPSPIVQPTDGIAGLKARMGQ